jgi:serine/threonine-protein kinase/endoribonuclease IRE1
MKLNESGSNQIVWTKCSKLLFFEPKSPARRTHLSNDLKKDLFVFTTTNSKNKKYKLLGNEIYIYNDLFLTMDYYMIYRGYINKPSEKAAVRKYSHFNKDLYEEEAELLKKLNEINPTHFLKYFATISCDEGYFLATELAEQSLYVFMKNNSNKNLDEIHLLKLVEQSCEGLNTLHNKNIVHSAIEPKNILISYPDEKRNRRVMLTNIEINNKNFNDNLQSISWVSFEVIKALKRKEILRITKKGDIFSMGCVMYFVLSKGQYLFGSGIERFSDKSPVFETLDLNPTHIDLIKSMVNCNDSERPSIKEVLIHPTFWSSEKKVLFFTHIKNILFTKNFTNMKTKNFENIQKGVINELEGKAQQIIGGNDWLKRLCPDVQKYEKNKNKHKISKTTEVKELINFIRNKDQHWDELKEEVLKKFGETPESYIDYFLGQNRFPSLLIHTYNAMKELKIERNLNNYYVIE